MLVQRCVGFAREAAVAFDGDGVFVGGEDFEVDALADQRADAGGVEDEPLRGLPAGARFGGQQAAGFLGQVEQDGGGFEQGDAGLVVGEDGDAAVRIQAQEVGLAVFALVDVDVLEGVGQAEFFQGDGGLKPLGELSV